MNPFIKKSAFQIFSSFIFIIAVAANALTAEVNPQMSASDTTIGMERRQDYGKDDNPYIIGSSNMLQIKIFGEAGVNQLYRVDEDGYIKHALIGRIKIGGMTVAEAEKLFEQSLDGDYIINPQVTIFVLEFSHFSIIGEVRKPGSYELTGATSLIRAISLAGGFTPIANQKGVQILRKNQDGSESKIQVDTTRITQQGDLSAEVDLQAEDVVVVPKSFF